MKSIEKLIEIYSLYAQRLESKGIGTPGMIETLNNLVSQLSNVLYEIEKNKLEVKEVLFFPKDSFEKGIPPLKFI